MNSCESKHECCASCEGIILNCGPSCLSLVYNLVSQLGIFHAHSRLVLCRSLNSTELTIFKAALAQLLQPYGVVSSYISIGTPTPVTGRRLLQARSGVSV